MDFDPGAHIFHSRKFRSVVNDAIDFLTKHMCTSCRRLTGLLDLEFMGCTILGTSNCIPKIAELNRDAYTQPIYVGKAVPPGWRKARAVDSETSDLHARLRQHTRSIQQAANLQIDDFRCRFMILGGIESDLGCTCRG